ncbi:hypothetical protein ACWCV9_13795 [Streptomyces sp. NPDC001606]
MLIPTVHEDSRLSLWLRVREYAVPPSMIEAATGRREAGDWAGACAAARIDVDLDLRSVARVHGRELASLVRSDLRRLAPDLLRWHMPRVAPDGLLRPGLTLTLARYPGSGRAGPVHLVARTAPAWADGGQRISLALWDPAGASDGGHPRPRPHRRFRLDLHRHLWDASRHLELRTRSGADGPAPPDLDPLGLAPPGLGCAVARWAAEAALLCHAEGRSDGAFTVRLGSRRRLVLELVPQGPVCGVCRVSGPVGSVAVVDRARGALSEDTEGRGAFRIGWSGRGGPVEPVPVVPGGCPSRHPGRPEPTGATPAAHPLRTGPVVCRHCGGPGRFATGAPWAGLRAVTGPVPGGTAGLPVLPDAAVRVAPDLELVRAGLLGADRLHPLVAAALAPGRPAPGTVRATDPADRAGRVECRGATHRIGLVDGVLAPLDHDPDEIRREELLAAFGGPPLPCLRAVDAAHRRPDCLPGVRERLAHGDTTGALAVVEGLLGPGAVLRDGPLRDELAAAAERRIAYGLYRAGLTGPGRTGSADRDRGTPSAVRDRRPSRGRHRSTATFY